MSIEACIAGLQYPALRLTSQQLLNLSNLDRADAATLAEAWPSIEADRRLSTLSQLADLAQDNVELNFDTVFKIALGDEAAASRMAALHGLVEYEGRDLVGPLAALLREDTSADVRRDTAMALGRYALAAELGQLGPEDGETVRAALIEAVEDEEEDELVRARAIEALGAFSGEETVNLIESIYREESLWLRVGAVDAMGHSCNLDWLPILLQELENPAPEMRHAAAFAAGELGDEAPVEALGRTAAIDPDEDVQRAAIEALGEIGGARAHVALKNLLYEGHDSLQDAIKEAMSVAAFRDDPLSTLGP